MIFPRLITAILGIPLIIFTVFWGGIPFFVIMSGIVFMSLREYFILSSHAKYASQPLIGTLIGLFLFMSVFLNGTKLGPLVENQGTAAVITLIMAIVFLREIIRGRADKAIERLGVTFLGVFFIPWTLGHFILIRSMRPGGMEYVYFLFIVIWLLDTGAYAVGKKIGKIQLSPISPKKTLEGGIGGVAVGMLAAVLCRIVFMRDLLSVGEAAMLGFVISVVAQFSDFAESILKRDAGVKDSAELLPGHGGILDRFDSFLFTAPFLYYYLSIVKGL
ncbi:MAG: phosphatidate cytidylyltransferase [Endomicrobiales bacterium]|nr:phosphatidate cytidylyltransferase [Endomicrobiales bacterium]